MDYIQTPAKKYNTIKIKGDSMKTFIKVKNSSKYAKAIEQHRADIKKFKAERKSLRRQIKLSRALVKQVKTSRKIDKLNGR